MGEKAVPKNQKTGEEICDGKSLLPSCVDYFNKENAILKCLKVHSQLLHMHIRYHFIANLHITLHLKKRM